MSDEILLLPSHKTRREDKKLKNAEKIETEERAPITPKRKREEEEEKCPQYHSHKNRDGDLLKNLHTPKKQN